MVLTDPHAAGARSLEEVVEEILAAGATAIQLRDKEAGSGELLPLARRLRDLCHARGALFLVNDRLDLALACGADGVHVGQDDLPAAGVRAVTPPGFVIGVSAETPELARKAQAEGADYVGCGPVWPTDSKADAGGAIGVRGLAAVVRAVRIPVVAIGGITPERVPELLAEGAAGVAVIRAVLAAPDPSAAVRALLRAGF
ncbi:MAG: thiamine phosphate synthase [Gemmatimonadales bacterium]|nr:MAG: thiamine phosphate synthase [Gemmatimonadales bacterium]